MNPPCVVHRWSVKLYHGTSAGGDAPPGRSCRSGQGNGAPEVRIVTERSIERIGFIGLGIMGRSMAANLLKAGFEVTVWNRTAARMQPLLDMGARGALLPAARPKPPMR